MDTDLETIRKDERFEVSGGNAARLDAATA